MLRVSTYAAGACGCRIQTAWTNNHIDCAAHNGEMWASGKGVTDFSDPAKSGSLSSVQRLLPWKFSRQMTGLTKSSTTSCHGCPNRATAPPAQVVGPEASPPPPETASPETPEKVRTLAAAVV